MIIDGRQYSGACACGRRHAMTTELCVIETGAMAKMEEYLARLGLCGEGVAIYDENTYLATEGLHPRVKKEIILPPEGLHADNHGTALAEREMIPCDYLIAIGSGTVHDITRYTAYERGIPFVSCPTAASVDGFCSSVAAMTWDGYKKTFTAVAPRLVLADLDVITKAPSFLTNAGFGDMIGKLIALADWRIGHALTGEYFCSAIHDMTLRATWAVIDAAGDIKRGDVAAYEKLTYGLLMSGLAMQLLGNSRCASGAEHHISHLIEMEPEGLALRSDALHGEKVGVGTLLAAREYHRIQNAASRARRDYPLPREEDIREAFGERLSASVLTENAKNCAEGITAEAVEEKWEELAEIIASIPTYDELCAVYETLGVKRALADIGVPEDKEPLLLNFSPLVRNRVTLMRLRAMMK